MKKYGGVIAGIFSFLYLSIIIIFLLYSPLFNYNAKYAAIQNAMLLGLPSISGVIIFFFLRKNTLKDFFKTLAMCVFTYEFLSFIYSSSRIHLKIQFWMTGYNEFGLGEGFLSVIIINCHLISCLIGIIAAGGVSLHRQYKK